MVATPPASYSPAADLLKGRHILITGAGDGLGRAAAHACARHGATVILLGRTISKLAIVYDEINAAGGAAAIRSEEQTSELQSLMHIWYADFCLKQKKNMTHT